MILGMIQRRFLRQEQCSTRKAWHHSRPESLACHSQRNLLAEPGVRRSQKQNQNRKCLCYFGASDFPHFSRIDSAVGLSSWSDLLPCIQSVFVILTLKDLVVVRDRGMDYVLEIVKRIFYVAVGLEGDQRVEVSLLRGLGDICWKLSWEA